MPTMWKDAFTKITLKTFVTCKNLLGIFISGREKFTSESQPIQEQEKVLEELLKKAKDTLFGKYYFFDTILQSDNIQKTFAEKVPFFDYHQISNHAQMHLQ